MKRKLLYQLALMITTSLSTASVLSVPMTAVPAVLTEPLLEVMSTGESQYSDTLSRKRQTAIADRAALLQEARVRGKKQAAGAAFDLAVLAAREKDHGRAADLLREAVTLQPQNTDYLLAASRMAFEVKDYRYAEAGLVKVVNICRDSGTADGTKLLVALDNLAILYQLQGKSAAATSVLSEGLALNTALYGEHHASVIQSLYRLAELDLKSANYGEAKQHLGRAVKLMDASPSPIADQDGAALLHNIGELYRVSGDYAEAESAYTKAMALWNRSPANNQREIAITQAGLDRLHAVRDKASPHVGLKSNSQAHNAPPSSSPLIESAQAQM